MRKEEREIKTVRSPFARVNKFNLKTITSFLSILALLVMIGETQAIALPPDTPNPNTWVTDLWVNAIAVDGNTIYMGGQFTYVGPNTGHGASISTATGAALLPYLQVDGPI